MPPPDYSHIRQTSETEGSSVASSTSGRQQASGRKFNLWRRLRVGVSQMFRRVAIFFRKRQSFKSTSSYGSERWEYYGEEDSVDYLVKILYFY